MASKTARCKSCKAPLVWATLPPTNKPHPFQAIPEPPSSKPELWRGRFAVVGGFAHSYGAEDAKLRRERFSSHMADCPEAAQWRGGDWS